ncbi:MAG: ABC transporter ATP-binding protein [Zoogloeaceae bacterium]|jgi:ABC-2 type transport system ATP-binding protein|nr:ABC transporter ATP-binding protein [Zoogloeaceae bacterium]
MTLLQSTEPALTAPALQFSRVVKIFRRARVLDGVDLMIAAGERVALIGSNGAGKTTLIRCLLGEYVHAGQILVHGLSPRQHRAAVLTRIGFVPQLPPPLKMSVGQLVRFAAALCDAVPEDIYAVAGRLGLDAASLAARPFTQLSGGMKQKLLIAIALGRRADLLILDEPAANLDPEARKTFFELLSERLGQTAMLISSHRLDEVSALVGRVVEMDMGRIVLDDVVADAVALNSIVDCRVRIKRAEAAFAAALSAWNFSGDASQLNWTGEVSGADRLRFLGVIARYTALIDDFSLTERKT